MTIEQIETFLAIVNTGTISAAAQTLFVGQSTVSHRIQKLEEELNIQLIMRGKGQHIITLTSAGEHFVPLAQQWRSLWKDTQSLESRAFRHHICIGSVDLVNNYTFLPFYRSLLVQHPEICLNIQTHHSDEIHSLLSNHYIDIGFVFSYINYPDIYTKPIYRELMYLICNKDSSYYNGISPIDLKPEHEIFLNWGSDYQIWHDRYWPDKQYLIRVNTGSMIEHYLTGHPDRWSLVPMSLVAVLKRNPSICNYVLSAPPPARICYQLTPRYPKPTSQFAVSVLLNELEHFIDSEQTICTFQPWMLNDKTTN